MIRRLFTLATVLSLLLCGVVALPWLGSGSGPAGAPERSRAGAPETRERRSAPRDHEVPASTAPATGRAVASAARDADWESAASLAARLTAADYRWGVAVGFAWRVEGGREMATPAVWADGPFPSKLARRLLAGHAGRDPEPGDPMFPIGELVPPLLRALDDPARAVAAHVTLEMLTGDAAAYLPPTRPPAALRPGDREGPRLRGPYTVTYEGLDIELTPDPPEPVTAESTPGGTLWHYRCVVRVDPAQFAGLRSHWLHLLGAGPATSHDSG
jgi:hypothetical protein